MKLYRDYLKRLFDVILASVLLIFFLAPMLILYIINIIVSGRPAFFKQSRIGRYGNQFNVIKYRTMINRKSNDSTVTIRGDSRITPIGSFMRRYKLDELPQLFNIFKGDMSFVGARPDVPGYMDKLENDDRIILDLRPGLTGPATIKYRDEEIILSKQHNPVEFNDKVIFPDKVRINLIYYHSCSFMLDMRIIFITIGVLKCKNTDFWQT